MKMFKLSDLINNISWKIIINLVIRYTRILLEYILIQKMISKFPITDPFLFLADS